MSVIGAHVVVSPFRGVFFYMWRSRKIEIRYKVKRVDWWYIGGCWGRLEVDSTERFGKFDFILRPIQVVYLKSV